MKINNVQHITKKGVIKRNPINKKTYYLIEWSKSVWNPEEGEMDDEEVKLWLDSKEYRSFVDNFDYDFQTSYIKKIMLTDDELRKSGIVLSSLDEIIEM